MPSGTEKQAIFMAACSHGAGYESCPPDKVSAEFNEADKGTAMLSNAMKHRVKRPMGGPVTTGTQQMNPATMLSNLQAKAAPNLPGAGGSPPPGLSTVYPPPQLSTGVVGLPMGGGYQQMQPPTSTMMPATGMMSLNPMGGSPGSPPPPPNILPNRPPIASMHPPMMTGSQGMPPPGALNTLQPHPGGMMRPMPMHPGPIGPPMSGRPVNPMMMRARGGLIPPGMAPQSPLPPTSPLSSLIGGGMAAMHGGPGLAPHMRKPRIPLPGALRNINQTINHARGRLGQLGPV